MNAPRLPCRLKSGNGEPPEKPQAVLTDGGLLDLESKWHSLQGLVKGISADMQGMSLEQARPLEGRLEEIDGEIVKIEARISEAAADGLCGLAVKLRLLDHYRDLETQDQDQQEACTRTALEAVERLLIGGVNVG